MDWEASSSCQRGQNRNDSYFCKTSSYANVIKASDNGEFKDVRDSHHSVSLQMENSNEFPLAILDDTDGCNRLSKWLCIKSSHASLVFATIVIPLNKVTYAIRNKDAESTVGLANDIGDENIYINNDQVHDECAHKVLVTTHKYGSKGTDEEPLDNDPFELDSLIKKRGGKDTKVKCSMTPDFPPGFSLDSHENQKGSVSCNKQEDDVSREHLRFSLVERLEETIKVGLALGLNMEGCENTLASLIAGNGEIIKNKIVCNENYVVVEGLWIPNDVRLMWIVVYAPQNLPSKIALWSSLTNIISNWDGNLIVMGDFNEVREAGERYRSIFNERHAEIFNEFLSNSALIDIPLGVILEKGILDHRPILLKEFVADYEEACGFTSLKKKLQNLKSIIRAWVASKKSESSMIKRDHESRLASIDAKVDQGCTNEEDFINRRDSIKILDDIHRMEAKDLAQKAKVKWAIEGEENTSFFHGMLKKKRRQLAIKGILKNGEWIEDPAMECQYKIIGKLLANRLSSVIGDVISPEQSDFIKGRNILDGPLIINEVMDWYRKRKKDLMIFNVDFEKAFDSLRWDFLDLVMEKLGFGHKWRSWIYGCLHNARSLVLVNGSPTIEFEVFRGLRQRDPLSHFLFILAMEGLHLLTCKAQETSLFKGASVGHGNMIISHLIYADDVIFIGEWSWQNAHNLLCMLRCFYLISGPKINVNKSNIFGVLVSDERVSNMANSIGCGAGIFPMNYLGVPVGYGKCSCGEQKIVGIWEAAKYAPIVSILIWLDEITFGNASFIPRPSTPSISSSGASSSSGPSEAALSLENAECSNCKLLTMKIKILEARLAMERHPEDHACQSAAILHELLNEMENICVE
ncbi:RNA-directed DNA polymerase, eukaryota, reverse transcriptase zinc-binding domain protein [Tanacetum coccineum]|uniref:RNA-directed DNA polymerase, eukaryota, reverse transcriptase zinc-binding domain protein n=1 Tax=Tanacetum coccineum TaxID=301880 RepID=A0ABQ5J8N1_9ASTR